jgi:hypothetical protein
MPGKIKIAVPTDDRINVRERFRGSRGFMVAHFEEGTIIHREMRWNLLSSMLTSEHGIFYNLADCQVILVRDAGEFEDSCTKASKKTIVQTDQPKVEDALSEYVERFACADGEIKETGS